jgi:malate dehydrogenase (oxaloacetate-decarboxylating)
MLEFPDKWAICQESNGDGRRGGPETAFIGADVCIAFSHPGPGVILPEWVRTMGRDAAVFAAANPVPEILPETAMNAGARIVATGRSDFPNQFNNSLVFPGIFRGVLDARARTISNHMAIAAAEELVAAAREMGLAADQLLPTMGDWMVAARIAGAVGEAAVTDGLARHPLSKGELEKLAIAAIGGSRACLAELVKAGLILSLPK